MTKVQRGLSLLCLPLTLWMWWMSGLSWWGWWVIFFFIVAHNAEKHWRQP